MRAATETRMEPNVAAVTSQFNLKGENIELFQTKMKGANTATKLATNKG